MLARLLLALLNLAVAGCAAPSTAKPGPALEIPTFAKSDPRVGQAGFVAETLRLHREVDGVRYTLMAFEVGDTCTLGAMVRGNFAGEVRWRIGSRSLHMPFTTAAPGASVPVVVQPAVALPIIAQGASFRGTTWINVDLPRGWLVDGSELQLQFVPGAGTVVAMPDAESAYCVRRSAR